MSLIPLDQIFKFDIIPLRRGPRTIGDEVMSAAEYARRCRRKKSDEKIERVGVIDMETDPFNSETQATVKPFTACIYTDDFDPIVIWEENFESFVERLIYELERITTPYTFYAHNGGRFDYMFLLHRLRGYIKFKGRGIMVAKIGIHELRDSFHILPEKLAAWKKDNFDYSKMAKSVRAAFRAEIIAYMVSDCRYLLEIVKSFLKEFGFKITIGQAAMFELKKHYKPKCLSAPMDECLRNYFYGGRVECLQGRGVFEGEFKIYDVNSMYPHVMNSYQHPIGNDYWFGNQVTDNTIFLRVRCRNYGGLVGRDEDGNTTATIERGEFCTTIWEFRTALKHRLIEDIEIVKTLDCLERTDFSKFVGPLYARRELVKIQQEELKNAGKENTTEFEELKKQNLFLKYILNNAYGKFAQNPRRFTECYITDPGERPPALEKGFPDFPIFAGELYDIWERPTPGIRFLNVGTAASITGAARSILLEAIQGARNPIYCDTDSLICEDLPGFELNQSKLGAWKLETKLDEVIIAGKKLYAYKVRGLADGHSKRITVRSKGSGGLTWADMVSIIDDQIIEKVAFGPTLTKTGEHFYMRRKIRATTARRSNSTAKPRIKNASFL